MNHVVHSLPPSFFSPSSFFLLSSVFFLPSSSFFLSSASRPPRHTTVPFPRKFSFVAAPVLKAGGVRASWMGSRSISGGSRACADHGRRRRCLGGRSGGVARRRGHKSALRFAISAGAVIKPGVYTLRYGVQPDNGDHLGVSPHRQFLLISPAADDRNPAPQGHDGTVELSKGLDRRIASRRLEHRSSRRDGIGPLGAQERSRTSGAHRRGARDPRRKAGGRAQVRHRPRRQDRGLIPTGSQPYQRWTSPTVRRSSRAAKRIGACGGACARRTRHGCRPRLQPIARRGGRRRRRTSEASGGALSPSRPISAGAVDQCAALVSAAVASSDASTCSSTWRPSTGRCRLPTLTNRPGMPSSMSISRRRSSARAPPCLISVRPVADES